MAKEAQAAAGSEALGQGALPPVYLTGNLRQRIQLLIVSQCYGGLFCGKMRLFPPHYPPALSETIAKNRGGGFAEMGFVNIAMLMY